MGSQKQELYLAIDTGSSDLWVPFLEEQGFQNLPDRMRFDCSSSSSCVLSDQKISMYYDDGGIYGYEAFDQISFADGKALLNNQSFSLINRAEGNMGNSAGLMGLSFQSLARNKNPTVLTNMVNNGLIDHAMFSMYLTDTGRYGSQIIFGGINPKYQLNPSSQFVYAPIIYKNSYAIQILGIRLGDKLIKYQTALIDSGTSCFTLPEQIMNQVTKALLEYGIKSYYENEQYSPTYSLINCHLKADTVEEIESIFPTIQIALNEKTTLELRPNDYIYHCKKTGNGKMACLTKLESSQDETIIILGDAFLQSFYTIFDQKNMQILNKLFSKVNWIFSFDQQQEDSDQKSKDLINSEHSQQWINPQIHYD